MEKNYIDVKKERRDKYDKKAKKKVVRRLTKNLQQTKDKINDNAR